MSDVKIDGKTLEKDIWKYNYPSNYLKMKIMKTLVWTTITHSYEGWTLKAEEKNRLQATEMFCYRRLLLVSWKNRMENTYIFLIDRTLSLNS